MYTAILDKIHQEIILKLCDVFYFYHCCSNWHVGFQEFNMAAHLNN